jgi:ATP-binding cassette subfamily C protein CydCD
VTSNRPHLVPPELTAHLPKSRQATFVALAVAVLNSAAVIAQAVALATAVDRSLLHHRSLHDIYPELMIVMIAFAFRAAVTLMGELAAQRSAEQVVSSLQSELVQHTLRLGPNWLAGERPGELSLTATRGLRSLHTYFARYIPQAAAAAVMPAVLLVWVATRDWLSLVVLLVLIALVPVTMIYFGRQATKRTERQWRRLGSLAGRFLQLIEGLPTLRAFGRDAYGRREIEASTEGVREATMRTLRVAFVSALAMDLIAGFGVGFVAMVLGLRLLWGQLDFTTAMAVLLVAPEIFIPLRRAGAEFHASTEGQAAVTRALAILNTPLGHPTVTTRAIATSTIVPATKADLAIDDLTISYEHRSGPAVRAFSLNAPAGTRVALVGPSGAGKSSVLAALLGFALPSSGTMSVGGVLSTERDVVDWRTSFAWLPQRPYLFAASLADNVRLGAPTADDDAVTAVLGAVGLGPLLSHLPSGANTMLGQDGLTLSAGERQRVALARALLSPAPILLLDEPTAALDDTTSRQIAEAMVPWLTGRTVVLAAHEPLLLPHFDLVHVFDTVPTAGRP